MTITQKSLLVMAIGVLMFFSFGITGHGELSIAGWVITAVGIAWYTYNWVQHNWRRRP
jgi:hypothetical protein